VEINKRVRKFLSPQRWEHTVGVRDTAVKLAKQYGCDIGKAEIAALLHDIARDFSVERIVKILKDTNPARKLPKKYINEPLVLHGQAGRVIAESQFGIRDPEILQSIELHTTGGPSMSLLDRILFVADYIEPGRTMRGVKTARRIASRDLEGAMIYILKSIFRYLLAEDRSIIEDTLYAYNEIILQRRGINGNQHR
jgi:predicted HD superfamily hydrolase involved in NAD metabolism